MVFLCVVCVKGFIVFFLCVCVCVCDCIWCMCGFFCGVCVLCVLCVCCLWCECVSGAFL